MKRGYVWLAWLAAAACLVAIVPILILPDAIVSFGRAGVSAPGEFSQPRAVAASEHGVAVIDKTGRLQLFELDGTFRSMFRVVPGEVRRGLPIGVTWMPSGLLAVADTHSSRVRVYDADGGFVKAFGEYGAAGGEFLYPQRIAFDPDGRFVVTDHGMGTLNRVQVIDAGGAFVRMFGGVAAEDGALARPMGVAVLPDGGYFVADQKAGLVRYDADGRCLGRPATWPADFEPMLYGLCVAPDGVLYATDLTGNRVLRFAPDGTPTGTLGELGTDAGRFHGPWDVAWHEGYLYVADTGNHRVQRIDVSRAPWLEP